MMRPASGFEKSHDVFQRDGLPYAAAAHDHDGMAALDEKADVIEYAILAERFRNIEKLDEVLGRAVRARSFPLRLRLRGAAGTLSEPR